MDHQNSRTTDGEQKRPGVARKLAGHANARLSGQKNKLADQVFDVVDAIRQVGRTLREENPQLASLADTTAGRLEGWSARLRDRDLSMLLDELRTFARRRPVLFVGGGIVLGVVAARVLKNSDNYDFPDDDGTSGYSTWSRGSAGAGVRR